MDEDDLVSYRHYTMNTTSNHRGKKRPAPSRSPLPQRTTETPDEPEPQAEAETEVMDQTYVVSHSSQQSIVGLQHTADRVNDMTDDEDF